MRSVIGNVFALAVMIAVVLAIAYSGLALYAKTHSDGTVLVFYDHRMDATCIRAKMDFQTLFSCLPGRRPGVQTLTEDDEDTPDATP